MEGIESKRISEIKELGVMCYNITVDKGELPQTLADKAEIIGYLISQTPDGIDDNALDEALLELGCICYNLYIENKIGRMDLINKCRNIYELNSSMNMPARVNVIDIMHRSGYKNHGKKHGLINDNYVSGTDHNNKPGEFIFNQPYGMEPIPNRYKKCKCGYRNRAYANYCGKCGALLKSRG